MSMNQDGVSVQSVVAGLTAKRDLYMKVNCVDAWSGEPMIDLELAVQIRKAMDAGLMSERERLRLVILNLLAEPRVRHSEFQFIELNELKFYFKKYGPEAIFIRTRTMHRSLLHIAVANGLIDVVRFLLDEGADIYSQDRSGMTPLEVEPLRNKKKVKRMLLFQKRFLLVRQGIICCGLRLEQGVFHENGVRYFEDLTHVKRVSRYSALLAKELGLSKDRVEIVRQAAARHDAGNRSLPREIFLKEERLSAQERNLMELHTIIGAKNFSGLDKSILRDSRAASLTHHEDYDGGGYPQGLVGDQIPISGRIIRVADSFDALVSPKSYHDKGNSPESTVNKMKVGFGTLFDPGLLGSFKKALPGMFQVRAALM